MTAFCIFALVIVCIALFVAAVGYGLQARASEEALETCRNTLSDKNLEWLDALGEIEQSKDEQAWLSGRVADLELEAEAFEPSSESCRSIIRQQEDYIVKARVLNDGLTREFSAQQEHTRHATNRVAVLEGELENLNEDLEILRKTYVETLHKTYVPTPPKRKSRAKRMTRARK